MVSNTNVIKAVERCKVRVTSSYQTARLLHIGEGGQARSLYVTLIATTQTEVV